MAIGSNSRIHKVYIRFPPWAFPLLTVQGAALDDPLDLRRRGLSDHAPLMFKVSPRTSLPAAHRLAPWKLSQHPMLAKFVDQISDAISLLSLPPFVAWAAYKQVLRAAADGVRAGFFCPLRTLATSPSSLP